MRLAVFLSLLVAACSGTNEIGAASSDESGSFPQRIAFHHPEYRWRVVVVSAERLRDLARLFGREESAAGLAMWREDSGGRPMRSCTMYMRPDATYDLLMHEARHCLEGHFHPTPVAARRPILPAPRTTTAGTPRS